MTSRRSCNAWWALSRITLAARATSSAGASGRNSSAPACTLSNDSRWPSTSCISRAISSRARSRASVSARVAGVAVHLLYLIPAVVVNVIVCGLFKPVGPTLARLALVFSLAGVTVEAASLLQLYVPLAMVEEGGALAALGHSQRQALSYLAISLYSTGFGFALLFFAGFCVLVGVLILRSLLVPGVLGAMMIVAGACYVVNTMALILSPALSDRLVPGILLPILLAELSLALWLVVKGVKVEAPEARDSSIARST